MHVTRYSIRNAASFALKVHTYKSEQMNDHTVCMHGDAIVRVFAELKKSQSCVLFDIDVFR